MVPVNIFSLGGIFSGGVKIFSGGVVEKFSRRSHVGTPPPRKFIIIFLKTEEVQKNEWGMIPAITYFSRLTC